MPRLRRLGELDVDDDTPACCCIAPATIGRLARFNYRDGISPHIAEEAKVGVARLPPRSESVGHQISTCIG